MNKIKNKINGIIFYIPESRLKVTIIRCWPGTREAESVEVPTVTN